MSGNLLKIVKRNLKHIVFAINRTMVETPLLSECGVLLIRRLQISETIVDEINEVNAYLRSLEIADGITLEIVSVDNISKGRIGLTVIFSPRGCDLPESADQVVATVKGICGHCDRIVEVTKKVPTPKVVTIRRKKYLEWDGGYEKCVCVDDKGKPSEVYVIHGEPVIE